jgi:hypothetical protein
MKKELAQKMLDGKLNFLPLEDSIQLMESGHDIDTEFYWVIHSEELEDNGYGMSPAELIDAHADIYGENDKDYLTVGNPHDTFDEFTLKICPAPTYMELIK